jgi:hypothetical protein
MDFYDAQDMFEPFETFPRMLTHVIIKDDSVDQSEYFCGDDNDHSQI